jgi:NADH-quinone oxidoreductase subunit N
MNVIITLRDIFSVSPLIALFLASLIPITVKVLNGNEEQNPAGTLWQGIGGLLAAAILLMTVYILMHDQEIKTAFAGALIFDGKTVVVGVLTLLIGCISLFLMYDNPATKGDQFSELVFLTLNSIFGMLVLLAANDLIILFVGLEMMSLSLYIMIAISHEQRLSKEAALKYFVLGGVASAILLYGISFIFGSAESTSLAIILEKTPELIRTSKLFLFGISLAFLGFCFKVSIFPFHAWTPDVYQGSPTPHSAFMATAVKAVSFIAFMRLMESRAIEGSTALLNVLQWMAVLTMIVGNVAALLQTNFKRMLAYSSVAHSGYILVGLIAVGLEPSNGPLALGIGGASSVIFYLIGYSIMTIGAFAIITLFERDEESSISVDDLAGYGRKRPAMALCLTMSLLSLAGIPPTLGFFGKFYLFTSAMQQGLVWLALWGMLNSVIAVAYYLRPIVVMYMRDGDPLEAPKAMNGTRAALIFCAVLILVLGVFSGQLYMLVETALNAGPAAATAAGL